MPEEQDWQQEQTEQAEPKKRIRRSPEQLAEAIDAQIAEMEDSILEIEEKKQTAVVNFDKKIEAVQAKISGLQEKKKVLLNPKARKPRMTKKRKMETLLKQAQKAGLTPEAIAEMLGLTANAESENENEE